MSPFNWRGPSQLIAEFTKDAPEVVVKNYPQKSYYWRRKAGLTGTRQNPDRHWRKREVQPL
jgi:hypothetical protein